MTVFSNTAQHSLHEAQARLDQLQKQRDEAFSAWRANPSSDLEKECYEDLKISLHKAEDTVNSLAAAVASTSGGRAFCCDQQVCILWNEVTQRVLTSMTHLRFI